VLLKPKGINIANSDLSISRPFPLHPFFYPEERDSSSEIATKIGYRLASGWAGDAIYNLRRTVMHGWSPSADIVSHDWPWFYDRMTLGGCIAARRYNEWCCIAYKKARRWSRTATAPPNVISPSINTVGYREPWVCKFLTSFDRITKSWNLCRIV